MFRRFKEQVKQIGRTIVCEGIRKYEQQSHVDVFNKSEDAIGCFSLTKSLVHKAKKCAIPKTLDSQMELRSYEFETKEDFLYRCVKHLDRQSIIFYIDCLPFFWEYFVLSSDCIRGSEYSMLDIGSRTGAGANLFGELFFDAMWGSDVKLSVDVTDLDEQWNSYCMMQPYINRCMNIDIFDMENGSYDFVFCSHTIEHLDDPINFIMQATNISRKFAIFYCPYNETNPPECHKTIGDDIISSANPVYIKHIKSLAYPSCDCVLFICSPMT